jgi:hypothetical protein
LALGSAVADAEAEHHEGRAAGPELGDADRVVAHGADIDGAQAERLGGDDGVLGGQRSIDAGHHEGLEPGHGSRGPLFALAHPLVARQVGDPADVERALFDMPLVAGDLGQDLAFGRIRDGDRRPELHVGAGGGRLRRGDQGFQGAGGTGVGQEAAHRAVVEHDGNGLVPRPGRRQRRAIALGERFGLVGGGR